MKLRLSPQALRDLDDIDDFTTDQWGGRQSAQYVGAIHAACERLAQRPALGRPRPGIPPHRLVYAVGRHFIIYEVDRSSRLVEVLRVLHQSMDIAARLAAER